MGDSRGSLLCYLPITPKRYKDDHGLKAMSLWMNMKRKMESETGNQQCSSLLENGNCSCDNVFSSQFFEVSERT